MLNMALSQWDFHHALSMDLLKSLADEQLTLTIGKNVHTLGEQFRHMARVQVQYVEALETRRIAVPLVAIEADMAQSRARLFDLRTETDVKMRELLAKFSNEELDKTGINWEYWGALSMKIPQHILALADHENLHNGQLIMYVTMLGLQFPESWNVWGFNHPDHSDY